MISKMTSSVTILAVLFGSSVIAFALPQDPSDCPNPAALNQRAAFGLWGYNEQNDYFTTIDFACSYCSGVYLNPYELNESETYFNEEQQKLYCGYNVHVEMFNEYVGDYVYVLQHHPIDVK
jgi:hypothetical protein